MNIKNFFSKIGLKKQLVHKFDIVREHYNGNYFNYHHFLKEWMIPLYSYLLEHDLLDKKVVINIEEGKNGQIHSDKWDEVIKQIFPDVQVTHEKVEWEKLHLKTWKYDEVGEISKSDAISFRDYVLKQLNIKETNKKVVLVERFKANDMNRPGDYGKQNIKYIENHSELKESLEKETSGSDYEFQNIFCENLSFKEQVELFHNTSVFIAQHGAALINLIWMEPGSKVIEYNIGKEYYWPKIISKVYDINHVEIIPKNIGFKNEGFVIELEVPVDQTTNELREHIQK
jgi:hypothetical protein